MRKSNIGILAFILCLGVQAASAPGSSADKPRVIVFEIQSDSLNRSTLVLVTQRLSREIALKGKFAVLDQKKINDIMLQRVQEGITQKENRVFIEFRMNRRCLDKQCLDVLHKLLGVTFLVDGKILKWGSMYLAQFRLIDIAAKDTVFTYSKEIVHDFDKEISRILPDMASKMAERTIRVSNDPFSDTLAVGLKASEFSPAGSVSFLPGLGVHGGSRFSRLSLTPDLEVDQVHLFSPTLSADVGKATWRKFWLGMQYDLDIIKTGQIHFYEDLDDIYAPFTLSLMAHSLNAALGVTFLNNRLLACITGGAGIYDATASFDSLLSAHPRSAKARGKGNFFMTGVAIRTAIIEPHAGSVAFPLSLVVQVEKLFWEIKSVATQTGSLQETGKLSFSNFPRLTASLSFHIEHR